MVMTARVLLGWVDPEELEQGNEDEIDEDAIEASEDEA
jgi:N utilization substance protein A